jgi:hypothetical protein
MSSSQQKRNQQLHEQINRLTTDRERLRAELERVREVAWDLLWQATGMSFGGVPYVRTDFISAYENATEYFEGIQWLHEDAPERFVSIREAAKAKEVGK